MYLPQIEDIKIDDDLVLKKIIAYKDKVTSEVNYDGEFTTNNLANRLTTRRESCQKTQTK